MSDQVFIISVPLRPHDARAASELRAAFDILCAADPGLGMEPGSNGEVIVKGQTERQLRIALDQALRAFKIHFDVGALQIAYRETITKTMETDYTHKEQMGASGQFARIKIRWEPLERGSGFVFEDAIVGDALPKKFIPGVKKGLTSAKDIGVLNGFPCTDLKAVLFDGAFHDVDSNTLAFEIAACAAFREGIARAGPVLLEPVMRAEVVTPEDYIEDVIRDLMQRRALLKGTEKRGNARIVMALTPMGTMLGYPHVLSAKTRGRAQYAMRFEHYEPVPSSGPDDDDNFPMAAALRA